LHELLHPPSLPLDLPPLHILLLPPSSPPHPFVHRLHDRGGA
jgi:hypothetical protein